MSAQHSICIEKNYTRYNTEDLQHLLDYVANGPGRRLRYNLRVVVDYGKVPADSLCHTCRFLLKGDGQYSFNLYLLRPEKMMSLENPVQRLAMASGEPRLSSDLTAKLREQVSEILDNCVSGYTESPDDETCELRLDKKPRDRKEAKSNQEQQKEARRSLTALASNLNYLHRQMGKKIEQYNKKVAHQQRVAKKARKLGIDVESEFWLRPLYELHPIYYKEEKGNG